MSPKGNGDIEMQKPFLNDSELEDEEDDDDEEVFTAFVFFSYRITTKPHHDYF